ncbi:MAG TPA: HAMP domain-containing histidine kinase [Candidatus Omnitrophica bacterium]|nr:HAMP domain-containing histidine kinase [Candidatus Omnitrophota bacterium]
MKHSLFFKFFFSFCLIILLLSILIFSFSFRTIRSHYINTLSLGLKNLAYTLKLKVLPLIEEKDFKRLNSLVKEIGKNIKTRITIIAPSGKVLADSEKDPHLMENHNDRPEVKQAKIKGSGKSLRFSTTVKEEMLYVAIPVKSKEKFLGVLRVSLFLKDINKLLNNLKNRIFGIVIFMTFLSLLGAFFFSKNLSYPLKELVSASKKLADGDFSARVSFKRKGEIGELAESFNRMSEELKRLFDNLTLKQEELNSIITSLEEGLLVLDKKGKIILFNESFKKIVQINPEGKFWWEVLRNPTIAQLIEKAKEDKRISSQELELNEKVFLCSFVFVPSKEELIIVLHNITEFRKLEKIKKDFVVNVSHELRTPLTAIKGYVETLEEEVKGSSKHYLDIIKKHTERLINIVSDLLLLSELEEKGLTQIKEKMNLEEIAENVCKIFEQKAKEKNLKLSLICESKPVIKGDPFKLEQMFINLIDNAIKYTEKGEVSVLLKQIGKEVIVKVKDTGIGIPEEHLDRIFERFYVVDKSRSKKLGGTGLGLSIVKHIVLLHNGKIDVESTPGKGTEFTITFPAYLS